MHKTDYEAPTSLEKLSSLGHMPGRHWEFDDAVTAVFDDMLTRSVPDINAMRDAVLSIATRFIKPGTDVLDLGCAVGGSLAPLVQTYGSSNHFVGLEVSEPMLAACRERFQSMIDKGVVDILNGDLRNGYPKVRASVTLCVLSLMFVPIEHRCRVLADAFECTLPGGVLILVEKVLAPDATTQKLYVDLYHEYKERMGYSKVEIDQKRLSLEGVLVPVTACWNEQILRNAGFAHVECFWRYLNFCGWIGIKDTTDHVPI